MCHALFRLAPIVAAFGFSYLLFRGIAARHLIDSDRRVCWGFATILIGGLFFGIGELAGALHSLAAGPVLALWLLADATLMALVWQVGKPAVPGEGLRAQFPTGWHITMLALAGGFALLVGVIALEAPTTIWDSMTYHMPRVMHWVQQGSLSHYPTNIPRQLESAPGAEIQTATLFLLAGNDWPVNLPQWWALLTCALLVSFLAEELLRWQFGQDKCNQSQWRLCGLLAAVISVTLPAGVSEAISTQNDYLAAMWATIMVAFSLLLAREPRNWFYACGVAMSCALGINNKTTMFLYAAPVGIAVTIWLWRQSKQLALRLALMVCLCGAVVNAPWLARNYSEFHQVLASNQTLAAQQMEHRNPAKIAANLMRNLALYAGTPWSGVNLALDRLQVRLNDAIGQPLDDPGSVWAGQNFHFCPMSKIQYGDGFGQFLTLTPVLLAACVFLVKFKWNSPLGVYGMLIVIGFAVFCGYLKWQPWHQRLHLAYFVMAAPFAGVVLGRARGKGVVVLLSLVLTANAALVLVYSRAYPLAQMAKPREEQYFCERPELYAPTRLLANDIVAAGVTNVWLKIGVDTWEYPLWVCLNNRGFRGTINHAFVDNNTSRLDSIKAVILSADAVLPPQSNFPVAVNYGSWVAHFPAKAQLLASSKK